MVVFDADTGTGNRFEPRFGTRDVNIGADGKLYSIGARFVSQDSIYVYDPITLEMERTLAHPNEVIPHRSLQMLMATSTSLNLIKCARPHRTVI
jgi:hypothetical protein